MLSPHSLIFCMAMSTSASTFISLIANQCIPSEQGALCRNLQKLQCRVLIYKMFYALCTMHSMHTVCIAQSTGLAKCWCTVWGRRVGWVGKLRRCNQLTLTDTRPKCKLLELLSGVRAPIHAHESCFLASKCFAYWGLRLEPQSYFAREIGVFGISARSDF